MPDEKEITIYDIAKHLNISATTVSRGLKDHPAINKNTRKKIVEAAKESRLSVQHICKQSAKQTNTYDWCYCSPAEQLFHVICIGRNGRCGKPGKL